jgi:hypothetical protein
MKTTTEIIIVTTIATIIGILIGINQVSAIHGGETYTETMPFEPVVCIVTDNLTYSINGTDVNIPIPLNYFGNFTLTCYSEDEADPVIQYINSGGGSGTKTEYIYKNITKYQIVELQGKNNTEIIMTSKEPEIIIKKIPSSNWFWISLSIIIIFIIIVWIISSKEGAI